MRRKVITFDENQDISGYGYRPGKVVHCPNPPLCENRETHWFLPVSSDNRRTA